MAYTLEICHNAIEIFFVVFRSTCIDFSTALNGGLKCTTDLCPMPVRGMGKRQHKFILFLRAIRLVNHLPCLVKADLGKILMCCLQIKGGRRCCHRYADGSCVYLSSTVRPNKWFTTLPCRQLLWERKTWMQRQKPMQPGPLDTFDAVAPEVYHLSAVGKGLLP